MNEIEDLLKEAMAIAKWILQNIPCEPDPEIIMKVKM